LFYGVVVRDETNKFPPDIVARVDYILPTVEIHSADAITDFLALDVGALMRVRVLKRNGEWRRFS